MYTIYTLNKNNIPFYVGCTSRDLKYRIASHKFSRDIDFTTEIIEITDNKEDERYWIQQLQSWGFILCNEGLSIGYQLKDSHKNNISKSLIVACETRTSKPRKYTAKDRFDIGQKTTKRYNNPEARIKHSERMKSWWAERK